ncbi:MAG: YhjD/YihY/BrkB family envelope integrity protein, partial [Chromatiales bacterium]
MQKTKLLTLLPEYLNRIVWQTGLHGRPFWQVQGIRWTRMLWLLARELSEGQLTMRAMSLVYTTLLSLVPLLAVSFSVLKAFGVQNELEPALLNFLAPLGPKGEEISATIIGFVDNMKVGVLGSVGLGMLLYTVVSLIQKVEQAFNYIWHVPQNRHFMEGFSDYLSVLLIGPVLVFSALGATASIMSNKVVQNLQNIPLLALLIDSIGALIPYLFVIAAFAFTYLFVPNTRVRLGPAIIGAIVAGALWQTIGWGFASFVVGSTKYAAIYSGFAILILFMIWLYLAWLILLIGANIAFYQQHPEYLNLPRRQNTGNRMREWIGLYALGLIARHHFDGAPPIGVEQLASRLGVTPKPVQEALDLLQDQGLVAPLNSVPETYLPARAAENIPLDRVLTALRRSDQRIPIEQTAAPFEQAMDQVFTALEQATTQRLQG